MAVIAIGPEMTSFGSWDWIGPDMIQEIQPQHRLVTFTESVPDCDAVLLIKHLPAREDVVALCERCPVIFCPIDRYGSSAEIDGDARFLQRCARIVVHADSLQKYFVPYAPVEYLDHHVKYVLPSRRAYSTDGPLLWVGVRTNLPPLTAWCHSNQIPGRLLVLTNPEDPGDTPPASKLGFPSGERVEIAVWSPRRHLAALKVARAAFDIKGDDFRARHKPPAKAVDFLASGLPLAVNDGHPAVAQLASLGFDLAGVHDTERWLSREYWDETAAFGAALRELLSRTRVGRRLRRIIDGVLREVGTP